MRRALVVWAAVISLAAVPASAALPSNDHFADAKEVTALPFEDTVLTAAATEQEGEPTACFDVGRTVWYQFTAAETVSVRIDLVSTGFSGVVAVYTGSTLGALDEVVCGDDGAGFVANAGTTYRIQVGGLAGGGGLVELAARLGGTIRGAVTDPQGDSIADVITWAYADEDGDFAPSKVTDEEGQYELSGLDPGEYRVYFEHLNGAYAPIWYGGAADFASATPINVAPGAVVSGIDIVLVPVPVPPPPPLPDNNDFADAIEIGALPFDHETDVSDASLEDAEPMPACVPSELVKSTVWYRFSPTVPTPVSATTLGSDFDSAMVVYAGTALDGLEAVACSDDSPGANGPSRVGFITEPGTTYYFQVARLDVGGGFSLSFSAVPGELSGTVTNVAGEPLGDICVTAYEADGTFGEAFDGAFGAAVTGSTGTYAISGLPADDYRIQFLDCGVAAYLTEWHSDKVSFDEADPVAVAPGAAAIVNAVLLVAPDIAVTAVTVENVPAVGEGAETDAGWERIVHVSVANLGTVGSGLMFVEVEVCATLGECVYVGGAGLEVAAGDTGVAEIEWNGIGTVGDVTVKATASPGFDPVWENNEVSVEHYVLVPAAGVGVNATCLTFGACL